MTQFIYVNPAMKNPKTGEDVRALETAKLQKLKEEGFTVGVAEWNIEHGKGIDDLLCNGYRPQYVLG